MYEILSKCSKAFDSYQKFVFLYYCLLGLRYTQHTPSQSLVQFTQGMQSQPGRGFLRATQQANWTQTQALPTRPLPNASQKSQVGSYNKAIGVTQFPWSQEANKEPNQDQSIFMGSFVQSPRKAGRSSQRTSRKRKRNEITVTASKSSTSMFIFLTFRFPEI